VDKASMDLVVEGRSAVAGYHNSWIAKIIGQLQRLKAVRIVV